MKQVRYKSDLLLEDFLESLRVKCPESNCPQIGCRHREKHMFTNFAH